MSFLRCVGEGLIFFIVFLVSAILVLLTGFPFLDGVVQAAETFHNDLILFAVLCFNVVI